MAEADWKLMTGSPDTTQVSFGKTDDGAFSIPGGDFALGFHSLEPVVGLSGLLYTWPSLHPISGHFGGVINASLRKFNAQAGGSPVLFFATGTDVTSAEGYMLGLTEEWPPRIALRKGLLSAGLSTDNTELLGLSERAFLATDWIELFFTMAVNQQGDLTLTTRYACPPTVGLGPYTTDPGLPNVIDDILGLGTGSPPLEGDFYVGVGHYNSGQSGRVSLFDWIDFWHQSAFT